MPKYKNLINNVKLEKVKSIDSFLNICSSSNTNIIKDKHTKLITNDNDINTHIKELTDVNHNIKDINNEIKLEKKDCYSIIDIKNKLNYLSDDELSEIFKIIKLNNENYSINKNGIFINLSTLKKKTILEISNFIIYCDNNNYRIIKDEEERDKFKNSLTN